MNFIELKDYQEGSFFTHTSFVCPWCGASMNEGELVSDDGSSGCPECDFVED
ncbi:MAG: hypothetical protein SV062_07435 [Thermodesulfobacteriota bacterium]|nr:hypothetical protein [Thermodesulfobacteriota bacterium]